MKKLLITTAVGIFLLGGQASASEIPSLNNSMQFQEVGKWAHFRDKYLLGRETENERRDRKEWERKHNRPYYHKHRHSPPPPPPPKKYKSKDHRHPAPPPPPPPRKR